MAIFEIQGPDGKTYEVDAQSIEAAAQAMQSFAFHQGGSTTDSAAVAELGSKSRSLASGFQQGGSYGLAENAVGALSALTGAVPNEDGGKRLFDYSGSFKDRYTQSRDLQREKFAADKAANPAMFNTGDVMGMIAQSAAAIPAATGRGLGETILRGGGIGMAEGALTGAGRADGVDTGSKAMYGGILGGVLGMGAPLGVAAASRAVRGVADPVTGLFDSMFNRANQTKANREMVSALNRSGKSQADIDAAMARAAADGQSEYRLVDALGVPGRRTASGIVRGGDGPAAREIAEWLEKRQLGQSDRVGGFIDDAFGTSGTTAAKTESALIGARGKAADEAYDLARGNAAPVDIRGALGVIDARIGGMKGSGIAGDSIDGKLAGYRSRLSGGGKGLGDDVLSAELSDFDRVLGVKQAVQDDIGAAIRAGRGNEARELGKLVNELDGALESASDMYRTANDGFRNASRVIDSVGEGQTMATRGRAADNVSTYERMNPEMQSANNIGYGDKLLQGLEANTAPTANKAKPLQSPKRDAEALAMAADPELYARRLSREGEMWATQNKALGGSATADNLQDIEAGRKAAGGLLSAGRSVANLQIGDAAAQIMATLGPIAKGKNEATQQLIARALMSNDPMAILAPALKQDKTSQIRRRFIEGIIRNTARPALGQ